MKKKLNYGLSLLLLITMLFSFNSCEKDANFKIQEYPEQSVTSFSPSSGRPGYKVTINGSDFGVLKQAVTVYFNGVAASQADIVSVVDDQIVVAVPENASTGKISVKVWKNTRILNDDFNFIPGGEITTVSPQSGKKGVLVTIIGKNFGSVLSDIKVTFGGANAEVVSLTDTKIEVKVPDDGVSGVIKVFVGLQEIEGIYFLVGEEKLSGTIIGTSGSYQNNPATTIAAAFDGDITTFVDGASASGYLGYDLGAVVKAKVTKFRYYPRTAQATRLNGARLYGTNDATKVGTTNGDLLYTIPSVPPYSWNEAAITSSTSYRYLYLYFATGNLNVNEVELYGIKD